MGSQLRRLRVKAGIAGSFDRSRSRVVVPTFSKKQLDISFVDDLPKQLALMPDREFDHGMEALRSEMRSMLATPEYRSRLDAFGLDLRASIERVAHISGQTRDEMTQQVQHVLRVIAERAEKEDR